MKLGRNYPSSVSKQLANNQQHQGVFIMGLQGDVFLDLLERASCSFSQNKHPSVHNNFVVKMPKIFIYYLITDEL
jgi:hypothetical protein